MAASPSPFERELRQRADEVLHYLWDPIGVSGIPAARDEYDAYLPQVLAMLLGCSTAAEIASFLTGIAQDRMGMSTCDPSKTALVGVVLVDWRELLQRKHQVSGSRRQSPSKTLVDRLYIEIMLSCDSPECGDVFVPAEAATDPMEDWAQRAAAEAEWIGWSKATDGSVCCPKCWRSGRG
jgi:hypothetical protein